VLAAVCLAAASTTGVAQGRLPSASARLPDIDAAVEAAIAAGQTPGAVVLIGRADQVLHLQAYGNRALVPAREAMTVDTVFDLASLTKVVATTPAVMSLVERGRIRLSAVSTYVPVSSATAKGA
jgi:CubicO group peptidase (beta-lactamase class C family)